MPLHDAEMICSIQAEDGVWAYIVDHPQSFIWSDDEEPTRTWNRLFGEHFGTVRDELEADGAGCQQLSFRDRSTTVQSKCDRDDRFRLLHALASITRPESDFRLCRDSTHSSDVAFLALSSEDWDKLESQFGTKEVAARFHSMESSFEEFMESGFAESEAPKGTLSPELTNWEGGSTYQPSKLDYKIVSDGPGQPRLQPLRLLVHQYLEPGVVVVSFGQSQSTLNVDQKDVVHAVTGHLCRNTIRVSNATRTGFLIIEQNGVAAGWRTDGWRPTGAPPTSWPAK